MLLSDRDIRTQIDAERMALDPSIEQPDLTRLVGVDSNQPLVLDPGEFVLGSTYESVTLPDDTAARFERKSSPGRLELLTHSTTDFIAPGFEGNVTLNFSNTATFPINRWSDMKIGQFYFFELSSSAEHPYGSNKYRSRYHGQGEPTASKSLQIFHKTNV